MEQLLHSTENKPYPLSVYGSILSLSHVISWGSSSWTLCVLSNMILAQQCSPRWPFVCIYSMCVWLCTSNAHACLRYERCHIHKILIEKQASEERETPSVFGKVSPYSDMCWVCLLLWTFSIFTEKRMWSWQRGLWRCIRRMPKTDKNNSNLLVVLFLFWYCNLNESQSPITVRFWLSLCNTVYISHVGNCNYRSQRAGR